MTQTLNLACEFEDLILDLSVLQGGSVRARSCFNLGIEEIRLS